MGQGKFLTFEGCEGVGKSTQVRLLREYLEKSGQSAVYVREPGGTRISEKIREIILDVDNSEMSDECEIMLYASARAQLINQVIRPALSEGKLVICDRYIDSTMAYQGHARGLGVDFVKRLNELTCGDCIPMATVLLDLDPVHAFKRKGGADANDRLEREALSFHQMVYEGYQIAKTLYPDRIISISPAGTKYETNAEIIRVLKERGVIN